jgi:hypothetical protein
MMGILFHKPAGFPFYFISGEEIPKEVLTTLEAELSYTVKDSDYALVGLAEKHAKVNIALEKEGKAIKEFPPWDGKVHFLKKSKREKLYFPIGLKKRVLKILDFYDIRPVMREEYNEVGARGSFEWHGPQLRDYQNTTAIKAIAEGGGVISIPTGGGKTMIALRLTYVMGLKTIILVHRKELFKQWGDLIAKTFGFGSEVISDGIFVFSPVGIENYTGPTITLAMVQTIESGMKRGTLSQVIEAPFDVMILDEAHHTPASTFYHVATKIDARYKYGFSATVKREDGEDMKFSNLSSSLHQI